MIHPKREVGGAGRSTVTNSKTNGSIPTSSTTAATKESASPATTNANQPNQPKKTQRLSSKLSIKASREFLSRYTLYRSMAGE